MGRDEARQRGREREIKIDRYIERGQEGEQERGAVRERSK